MYHVKVWYEYTWENIKRETHFPLENTRKINLEIFYDINSNDNIVNKKS